MLLLSPTGACMGRGTLPEQGLTLALMVQSLVGLRVGALRPFSLPYLPGTDAVCMERWYIGPWDASRALVGQVGTGVPTASCPPEEEATVGLVERRAYKWAEHRQSDSASALAHTEKMKVMDGDGMGTTTST